MSDRLRQIFQDETVSHKNYLFGTVVRVKNLKNEVVKDVALTQIFPSGWEILNTRFTDFGSNTTSQARFSDIRDDRVNFYFDMQTKKIGIL